MDLPRHRRGGDHHPGLGGADATTLSFGYDDARRLERITDGLGNYIAYTLDPEGNREEEKTFDAAGILHRQLTQTFDLYNRLDLSTQGDPITPLEQTDPTYAPDGTLDLSTDGKGTVTDYGYDALKRLTAVIQDQTGLDPTTANATTGYDYDVADRLTQVVGATTTYAYDDLGNLLTQTSPDTGTTRYSYDAAGNLVRKTEVLGTPVEQTTTYTYDALNRLLRQEAPGSASDRQYRYDTCVGGAGRLCQVTTATGRVRYAYDAFGQVTDHQGLLYTYDPAGRVSAIRYPSGAWVLYSYNPAGELDRVDFQHDGFARTLLSNAQYHPFGPLESADLGNGLTLVQEVDAAYRITAQRLPGLWERLYTSPTHPKGYDANGNLLTRSQDGAGETFAYDPLDRLDTAAGPYGNRDYDHDPNGNRIRLQADAQITDYGYEPASNRMADRAGTPIILDAYGNTRHQGDWTYDYTPAHRLAAVTEGAQLQASFVYNGFGQRTTKTDEATGTVRHFLYGTDGALLAELDGEGNLLTEYLHANGRLLALYRHDSDADGVPNEQEPEAQLPLAVDRDGDGVRDSDEWLIHGTDALNPDSDGDGTTDGQEILQGTDPSVNSSYPGSGDLNGNGHLDAGDLVLLTQLVLGTRTAANDPEYEIRAILADQNQDGQLNAADVLLLQRRILDQESFPTQAAIQAPAQPETETESFLAKALKVLIDPAQAAPGDPGVLYYVQTDHLGTPVLMTDEQGVKVWSASHDPFGLAAVDEDPDGDGQNVSLNVRFPGQYYDDETGLHYNYFRYYDPETGRYLTSDPIELRGGLNTYTYVEGNPTRYSDYYGLDRICGPGSIMVGINPDGSVNCVNNHKPNESACFGSDCKVYPPSTNSQCMQRCMNDPNEDLSACDALGIAAGLGGKSSQGMLTEAVCDLTTKTIHCTKVCEKEIEQCPISK